MKILQLNIWTGRIKGALLEFFKNNDFDVICLQEAVWAGDNERLSNFFATVEQIKEASGLKYEMKSSNWSMEIFSDGDKMEQGNVILSRYKITSEESKLVYGKLSLANSIKDFYEHAYTLQIAKLENGLTIVNHHGYWQPNPIGNDDTIKAMKKVSESVQKIKGPVVMCGDLNVIHDSPAMRELDFLRDLTAEYNLKNTLSGLKFVGEVACDHILVNEQIEVADFKVLDDLISDHKPLLLEIKNF